ncbi:MAG: tRNA (N(6)-L-threonylcarbamoyladenosine(37)-C(2))-methylthiotransferase MtaB, partial [Deltaproteobacteria bacterium]|nr:tRNA (N(6)-L-threonylcarbamoyladenosine(37)-C(2))-methylthiotransferase MtaB [Deltaproteobacteria bacterium]
SPPLAEPKPRAAVHSLGCRLNHAEADSLRQHLESAGYQVVPWGEAAEVCVLNSCTVTGNSDAKSRQALRSIRRKYPQAKLAVVGCYAQMGSAELAGGGLADLIVGTQEKMEVVRHLKQLKDGPQAPVVINRPIRRGAFRQGGASLEVAADEPQPVGAAGGLTGPEGPVRWTRGHLKVQDGCDFMCSFCVISFARGRARPREWEDMLREARQMAQGGIRELVLTGVNVGTFQEGGRGLEELVDGLARVDGITRLRIGSIEPTTVGDGLLERMADPGHCLQPFLHLPLQSGADGILSAMKRRYTAGEYLDFARKALARVEGLCLGTDVLAGFPGETDALHQETRWFLEELPFAYFHVFPYSPRKGTPAAGMADPVSHQIKQQRVKELTALSNAKRLAFQAGFVGKTVEVLFEKSKTEGTAQGYTPHYIRVEVAADNPDRLWNRVERVRLNAPGLPVMGGELIHFGTTG